jgi:hypothetical protein
LRVDAWIGIISAMTLNDKDLQSVDSAGAVSSVVEHYLDTVGVTGSNPVSRTILSPSSRSI